MNQLEKPKPWWRFAMVWLVLSGPAAVVVASIVTAVIAWQHIDPVIGQDPEPAPIRAGTPVTPATPALQARNHAAAPKP